MAWLLSNYPMVLFILSEVIALIPGIQANSITQLVMQVIKSILAANPPKPPMPPAA